MPEADSTTLRSWKLLFKAVDSMRMEAHRQNPPHLQKITIGKLRVIGCLFRNSEDSMMLKEIAERFRITPGAVSQTVDVLVRENMVERLVSPTDRRAVAIRLTRRGEAIRNQLDNFFTATMNRCLATVSPEKLAIFLEVLETVVENILKKEQKE